jgi:hypothetical protein
MPATPDDLADYVQRLDRALARWRAARQLMLDTEPSAPHFSRVAAVAGSAIAQVELADVALRRAVCKRMEAMTTGEDHDQS